MFDEGCSSGVGAGLRHKPMIPLPIEIEYEEKHDFDTENTLFPLPWLPVLLGVIHDIYTLGVTLECR